MIRQQDMQQALERVVHAQQVGSLELERRAWLASPDGISSMPTWMAFGAYPLMRLLALRAIEMGYPLDGAALAHRLSMKAQERGEPRIAKTVAVRLWGQDLVGCYWAWDRPVDRPDHRERSIELGLVRAPRIWVSEAVGEVGEDVMPDHFPARLSPDRWVQVQGPAIVQLANAQPISGLDKLSPGLLDDGSVRLGLETELAGALDKPVDRDSASDDGDAPPEDITPRHPHPGDIDATPQEMDLWVSERLSERQGVAPDASGNGEDSGEVPAEAPVTKGEDSQEVPVHDDAHLRRIRRVLAGCAESRVSTARSAKTLASCELCLQPLRPGDRMRRPKKTSRKRVHESCYQRALWDGDADLPAVLDLLRSGGGQKRAMLRCSCGHNQVMWHADALQKAESLCSTCRSKRPKVEVLGWNLTGPQ